MNDSPRKVPFRRVAISSLRRLLDMEPSNAHFDDVITSVFRWIDFATDEASDFPADAIMIREHMPHRQLARLVEAIHDNYRDRHWALLVNHTVAPDWPVEGYHTKEGFKGELAPYDDQILTGKSCHSYDSALDAEEDGYDYIFYSPVFPTDSHPGEEPVGVEALAEIADTVQIPVFALGGVTPENEAEALENGAYGIAAITCFLPPQEGAEEA